MIGNSVKEVEFDINFVPTKEIISFVRPRASVVCLIDMERKGRRALFGAYCMCMYYGDGEK